MKSIIMTVLFVVTLIGCSSPPPPATGTKVTEEQFRTMDGIERGDPYVLDNLDGPVPSVTPQRPGKQVRMR